MNFDRIQFTGPFGLIGHPVAHSLSPVMHNAALLHLGLPYRYWLYDIPPANLDEAVQHMKESGVEGFNVTIPHKLAIMDYLDDLSEDAKTIGAVNTVCLENGRWVGYNTDAPGLLDSLKFDAKFQPAGCKATVLGAGGAARAAAIVLAQAGSEHIAIFNRRRSRAEELADDVRRLVPRCEVDAHPWDVELMADVLRETNLLVNATPIGMHPNNDSPVADPLWIHPNMVVLDLVYRPLQTKLLQDAASRGAKAVDGLGMLLYQGARAFQLWTKRVPPIDMMRSALRDAIAF